MIALAWVAITDMPIAHQRTLRPASRKPSRPVCCRLLDAQLLASDSPDDYELTRLDNLSIRGKMKAVPVMTFSRDLAAYE